MKNLIFKEALYEPLSQSENEEVVNPVENP